MNYFELLPTEDNLIKTLNEDLLGRNLQLAYFYSLLESQKNARTIAIEGKWGSGKTFFAKQSIMIINAKNPMSDYDDKKREKVLQYIPFEKKEDENYNLAVYYDSWANDNNSQPIISLIYEIAKQLGLTYMLSPDFNVFKTAASVIEIITDRDIKGIAGSLKSDNPIARFEEEKELDVKINQFLSEIINERGNRLIVFIDELDRCKPSFAVQLLEQIKHFLNDERITFVLSVNVDELQHTIKRYYGESFDASRYLDRFFDLRVPLPKVDSNKLYIKLGLTNDYIVDRMVQRIIDLYHFEIREIYRFVCQVNVAVYDPAHNKEKWDFSFSDGYGKQILICIFAPIVIALNIMDISKYYGFIDGKDPQPLYDIFSTDEFDVWPLEYLLAKDESYEKTDGKKQVTKNEKLEELYNAIFVEQYNGRTGSKNVGHFRFDKNSKQLLLSVASMLSRYADYGL